MERDKLLEKIKKILLKKAEGFFYTEETCEFQQADKNEITQLSIFEGEKVNNTIKINNDKDKEKTNFIMSKKKVTTHYIPPDMLAIKMLIENFGQKINDDNDLSKLSDEELINLQKDLINKIKNIEGGSYEDS